MNNRIARKIVTGKSSLSVSWSHVMQARARLRNHKEFLILPLTHAQFLGKENSQ
jgi:hypothetical protein